MHHDSLTHVFYPKALLDYLSVLRKGTHPHGHPMYLFPPKLCPFRFALA